MAGVTGLSVAGSPTVVVIALEDSRASGSELVQTLKCIDPGTAGVVSLFSNRPIESSSSLPAVTIGPKPAIFMSNARPLLKVEWPPSE